MMTNLPTSASNQDGTAACKPRPRGFAAMDPERRREVAGLGGRAAHQSGHAHEFTVREARAAAKKSQALRSNARPSKAAA